MEQINTFQHFVYVIKGIGIKSNKTKYYIGYTDNLYQRIRKHNCELVGGAKATKGYKFTFCCIFTNIRSRIEGLQLEKRLQICKKKGNIIDKINTFFQYIDTHNKVSPNGILLSSKIFLYIDQSLLPKPSNASTASIKPTNASIKPTTASIKPTTVLTKPTNALIFNVQFTDIILDHIMSSVNYSKLLKMHQQRQNQYKSIEEYNKYNSLY